MLSCKHMLELGLRFHVHVMFIYIRNKNEKKKKAFRKKKQQGHDSFQLTRLNQITLKKPNYYEESRSTFETEC